MKQFKSWSCLVVLACTSGFMLTGCAAETSTAGAEGEEELVGILDEALHTGGGSLPWQGAARKTLVHHSRKFPQNSVAYSIQVGVSDKRVKSLHVCSYTPTHADNLFYQGDDYFCFTLGKQTAQKWHTQQCPPNYVVAGYRVGAAGNSIARFGTFCRNVTDTNQTFQHPTIVADSNIFFDNQLVCGGVHPSTLPVGFVSDIIMNGDSSGMGAECIKP